jgi:hypothetical protein
MALQAHQGRAAVNKGDASTMTKTYYSGFVKDNDARKMELAGWKTTSDLKHSDGSLEVTFVKGTK